MATTDVLSADIASQMFIPLEVLELESSGQFVRVSASEQWDSKDEWARLATGPHLRPQLGDTVLVAGHSPDNLYVIGCLSPPAPERLETTSGVYAERCTDESGSETLRVMSGKDELLFAVDPARGTTRLSIPNGTLELTSATGDVVLRAGGTVRLEGNAVDLQAKSRLTLAVLSGVGIAKSWFRMLQDRIQTGGEKIEVSAREADLNMVSTTLISKDVSVKTDLYQLKAQRAETVTETLVERHGNVYRTVRELVQLQAGRLRTFVSGISHFRSKRSYISAEETIHIDGEKVHLG